MKKLLTVVSLVLIILLGGCKKTTSITTRAPEVTTKAPARTTKAPVGTTARPQTTQGQQTTQQQQTTQGQQTTEGQQTTQGQQITEPQHTTTVPFELKWNIVFGDDHKVELVKNAEATLAEKQTAEYMSLGVAFAKDDTFVISNGEVTVGDKYLETDVKSAVRSSEFGTEDGNIVLVGTGSFDVYFKTFSDGTYSIFVSGEADKVEVHYYVVGEPILSGEGEAWKVSTGVELIEGEALKDEVALYSADVTFEKDARWKVHDGAEFWSNALEASEYMAIATEGNDDILVSTAGKYTVTFRIKSEGQYAISVVLKEAAPVVTPKYTYTLDDSDPVDLEKNGTNPEYKLIINLTAGQKISFDLDGTLLGYDDLEIVSINLSSVERASLTDNSIKALVAGEYQFYVKLSGTIYMDAPSETTTTVTYQIGEGTPVEMAQNPAEGKSKEYYVLELVLQANDVLTFKVNELTLSLGYVKDSVTVSLTAQGENGIKFAQAGKYDIYIDTTDLTTNCIWIQEHLDEATPTTIYLKPNSDWKSDGARFAIYTWNADSSQTKWIDLTDTDSDGLYEVTVSSLYQNYLFARMNGSTTENAWANKWNQTADLTVPTNNEYIVYEITGWDNSGSWAKLPA